MAKNKKKIFVLDTNVILHDSSCIYQFEEHDVVIPITVIEGLDKFKKGKDTLNCNAREFFQSLDSLTGDRLFNGGVSIGADKGKITICLEKELHETLRLNFSGDKPDHHILNSAYHIANDNPDRPVILITKNVNLRLKAKSIGLRAENYTSDHIGNVSELYTGKSLVENISYRIIDKMYNLPYEFDASELDSGKPSCPNEYLILKNGSRSALAAYDSKAVKIHRVEPHTCFGIKPRNAEQNFAMDALMKNDIPLVTISGKAGTGKTLLALAAALESKQHYHKILIARPTVPLSNKDIGFLPGDINSKLDPYMQPLFDNLSVIKNQFTSDNPQYQKVTELLEQEKIMISPLSYIRGRSLVKVFFIIDEAQNLTPHEIKTIITRAGEGTKIVFTGDMFQIDHPYLDSQSNGLSYLIEKMRGQELYAHINLEKGERSKLSELATSVLN